MFRALERDLGVSVLGVPYIGDRTSDVLAARGVGARPILVRTGVGAATERSLGDPSIAVFDDLWSAAQGLLAEEK
jgi:D-glycero-D-manno-heptose 1,7-bisphosphate phosphatase